MNTLFDPGPGADPPKTASYGSRLTAKNNGIIAAGRNPATMLKIIEGDQTCGDCIFLRGDGDYGGRKYFKCANHRGGQTFGPATDIRKSWPACELFKAPPCGGETAVP